MDSTILMVEIKRPIPEANSIVNCELVDVKDNKSNEENDNLEPNSNYNKIKYANYSREGKPKTKIVEKFITLELGSHPEIHITYSPNFRFKIDGENGLSVMRSKVRVDGVYMELNITNFKYKKIE